MPEQRHVGGLWCGDVMQALDDYVAGALPESTVAAVHEHLGGCDYCERFGGEYAALVASLRQEHSTPEPVSEGLSARLQEALAKAQ